MQKIPLSLYIHLPWCIRKCPYCDFNSHALHAPLPEVAYVQQLIQDFEQDKSYWRDRVLHSIFMGGGTPSLFSPHSIAQLLNAIRERMAFVDDIEITMEANPGTVNQQKFAGFYAAGVNRLSLGIQSFQSDKLQALGRIHNAETAMQAVVAAREAGFKNFNLDLMHGLPGQSIEDAEYDLRTALSFQPPHLSWYQLTLEPHTAFYHKPPNLPSDEILADIQQQGHQILQAHHYDHYEVSAYCQPGFRCRHNLNYWQFGDYLGIGAGAHGKITCAKTGKVTRYTKIKHPREYLQATKFVSSENIVEDKQLSFEFMLNALRLHQPVRWELFTQRTGLVKEALAFPLEHLAARELISFNQDTIELTVLGQRFLNNVLSEFL